MSYVFASLLLNDLPPETFNPPPLLTGDDLRDLGIVPGPKFKLLLDAIRTAQLDGEVTTKADAVKKINHLSI